MNFYNDIILHHSSKSGITGQIRPISRDNCDFGKGFYLGTMEKQTMSLVLPDKYTDPVYYRINLKLSEIPKEHILFLKDMEWAYYVIFNRGCFDDVKNTAFYEKYKHLGDNKDVIIGPIADDNMRSALLDFEEGYITDVTLKKCLESIDYGLQYTLKTNFACSKTEILEQIHIKKDLDLSEIKNFAQKRKNDGVEIYKQIRKNNRREGKFVDEIISEIKDREELDYDER